MNSLDRRFIRIALMSRWNQSRIAHDHKGSDRRIARLCLLLDYEGQKREANGQFGTGKKAGGASSGKSQSSSTAPQPTVKRTDATAEYHRTAKPGSGKVTMREGYRQSKHQDEINTAHFLRDTFGGDVELIPEAKDSSHETPDFIWRGQNWELKGVSSIKSVDGAVRKALSQLGGSGGVILRYPSKGIERTELEKAIDYRVRRSYKGDVDVMLIQGDSVTGILRYKK